MRQEVKIKLELILDSDAKLSRSEIEEKLYNLLQGDIEIIELDIAEFKEEFEIYTKQ